MSVVDNSLNFNSPILKEPGPGPEPPPVLSTHNLKYEYATELLNEIVVYCPSVYVCPVKLCIKVHVEPFVLPKILPSVGAFALLKF